MVSMTIRLFDWQVEKLKQSKYPVEILRRAFKRYERGEIHVVVQNDDKKNKDEKCTTNLKSLTIRNRFPVPDSLMRAIISEHWNNPDIKWRQNIEMEIKKMDDAIDELFRAYENTPYIVEDA